MNMAEARPSEMPAHEGLSQISWAESFHVWLRVALLSFGGPAAQIAVMHRIIVDEKKWLDERRFLHALNFCMLLPGPEAQQLATYIGWLIHGVRGGLMAGLLFILPGFVSILVLSLVYVSFQDSFTFQSLFFGLKCAVLAVVAEAVVRVGRRVLKNPALVAISVVAFFLLWLKLASFPVVIGIAAMIGTTGHVFIPSLFQLTKKTNEPPEPELSPLIRKSMASELRRSLVVSVVCITLWFLPILLISRVAGRDSVFVQSSVFFSKAAVVTFGGAYSVLSYVNQQAVENYHWLKKGEMVDGLGLAETTPGPLIMVVQFVGFLAAWRHAVDLPPLLAGTLGAILTTWVTFVPCFYWIFLGAPYVEKLLYKKWLTSAMTAITASVVGVIATLGVNFAIATLFAEHRSAAIGWGEVSLPEWSTVSPEACVISLLAAVMIFVFHRGLTVTLLTCVTAGVLLRAFT